MDDLNIQAGVTVNAEQAERAFTNLGDKAQKMANEVTKAADKAGKATDGMGDGAEKSADKFTRAESRMRSAIQKSTRELEMLGKTASQKFEAQLEFKGLDKAKFQPFLAELRKTEEAAAKAQAGVSGIGDAAKVAGSMMAAAFSGAALLGVVGKVVSVQREFDVLNSSLKTVTGSSAAAEREMAWLKDFAKETPFGLAQATQGFVKMKALGLDPTRAALTSFGNTASAMGKDLNQMIEAVADASTGEFERLKEFGIKAKKEGDNVSLTFQGVTTTIRNSAADITKYLEDIGNTSFGGAMEERAKTLDGTIAALGDTWDELFRTVSTNNVGGLIFDSVTLANGVLEDATTIIRAMGGAVGETSREFGSLSAIQGGVATFFETVSVLAANTLYVLRQTGDTMAGVAAGYKAFFSFDFDAVRAIGAEMKANGEAARKEIDATTARILNARKEQEEYARYATRNASAATDPRRIDLGGSAPRATGGVSSGTAKAVKETISEYDKLIKKLSDELPRAAAEAEAAQMGYNKAQTEFLALAGSDVWASFTNSQRAFVASLFEGKIASEQAAEAAKTLAKANLEAAQSREKYIASLATGLDKIQADIAAQIEATQRMGLSKEAIAALDAAKLEMLATDLELQAIKAMDRNLDEQTYDALKKQAQAYRDLAKAKQDGAAKETMVDMAKSAAEEWKRTADSINQSLTDALMRGFESGKDFAKNMRDTVVNMFKTMVLRPVISVIVNPVAGAVTSALGLSGAANAATGGSGAGNAMSTLSLGKDLYSAITDGFSTLSGQVASWVQSGMNWMSGSGGMISQGPIQVGGIAQGVGSLAGTAAGVAGGIYGGRLISGGYSAWGNSGNSAVNVGTAIGTIWGPIGSLVGGLIGGAVNRLFGRKLKDSGVEGDFGGATGFEGRQFEYYKGGVFRSDKTKYKDLDEETRAALADTFNAMRSGAKEMAGVLGLGTQAIDGFTAHVKVSLKGLSAEEADKRLKEEFDKVAESLASTTLGTQDYTRTGETALQTLTRLSGSLTGVNQVFENLGATLYASSLAGADMASQLVDLFGGMDGLSQTAGSYMQNYYSADEQRAAVQRQLQKAFDGLDLKMPDINAADARAQFRALADAQDLTTEAGRKTYASLLQLSGAFAGVTQSADDAREAARQLAEEQARKLAEEQARAAKAAYSALEKAIAREREALEVQRSLAAESVDTLTGIFETIRSNVRELYSEVGSTAAMQVSQANAFIDNALRTAQTTGYMPDGAALSEAISTARGGLDPSNYASRGDMERDQLTLAYKLTALGDITGVQLTTAEQTLAGIEEQIKQQDYMLEYWKQQIDIAQGGVEATLTVEAAVRDIQKWLEAKAAADLAAKAPDVNAPHKPAGRFAIGGSGPNDASGGVSDGRTQKERDAQRIRDHVGMTYGDSTDYYNRDALAQISAMAGMEGWTAAQIGDALGIPGEVIRDMMLGAGFDWWKGPRYAVGTNYVARDHLAMVHEGEAIIPKAYNPAAMGSSGVSGGNAEMAAEIRSLRQSNEALQSRLDAIATATKATADLLQRVTQNGRAMQSEGTADGVLVL